MNDIQIIDIHELLHSIEEADASAIDHAVARISRLF